MKISRFEFAKRIKAGDYSCIGLMCEVDCPYGLETTGDPNCKSSLLKDWANGVLAEKEEVIKLEREYKVGDVIRIPHAEELLLKGWVVEDLRLTFNDTESVLEISWCGKDVEISMITDYGLTLDECWYFKPGHLGLPKIKKPRPEPQVGEFYRTQWTDVIKILADRVKECPEWGGRNRYISVTSTGEVYCFEEDELEEKVTGWGDKK